MANNTTLNIEGEGIVKLATTTADVIVNHVQIVPNICANLLSVSAMTAEGLRVEFGKLDAQIKNADGYVLGTATNINGMYRLDTAQNSSCFMTKNSCTSILWHRRLGHISVGSMQKLNVLSINSQSNKKIASCETCILGKHAKLPFKQSVSNTTAVLELVHTDLCGPMQVSSLQSSKYFITFVDDFSGRVTVYCIENKSMVLDIFKEFKPRAETHTGNKLKILRSDNGTEYCNRAMSDFLRTSGIEHQTTVPYNPQQNGVAERMNRTLVEKARCMLFGSNLDIKFWAEAIITAAHIINRLPSSNKQQPPEDVWSKRETSLTHLRVFGCRAMAHIPKEKRSKFQPKSSRCIFVGYCTSTKGYKLYNPETRKIFTSRDVKFFEDELKVNNGENFEADRGDFYFFSEKPNQVEEVQQVQPNVIGVDDEELNDSDPDRRVARCVTKRS